jgi:ABC-type glycerol-3-phosphate transport system substrate-binding protein
MKKLLVLLVAGIIAVPLFAGARRQQPATGEKTPLTISFWWSQQNFGGPDDVWGSYIEDKFNVDIRIVVQDWGDYQQKFRLWAASGELPDTFSGYVTQEPWFAEFIRQDLIRPIPANIISKYPNIKHRVDTIPIVNRMKDFYGDYYYIPRLETFEPGIKVSTNMGLYYRKDWAEKLGFRERPRDLDALYDMLYAFINNDPDGNGKKDTYGITVGTFDFFYFPFGAFPGRRIKDAAGKFIPGYADEEPMVGALTWLRKAWSDGLIDREMPGNSGEREAKFAQGAFGVAHASVQPSRVMQLVDQQFASANPAIKEPLKAVDWIGSMSAKKGGTEYKDPQFETCGSVFRSDLSDVMLEKYLEICNWMMSEEGKTLAVWGFKDVDYKVNADGTKTYLLDTSINVKYPSADLLNWATWVADINFFERPGYTQGQKDWSWAWQQDANKGAANSLKIVDEMASMLITEERSLFDFDINSALFEIISGTGDVRTMYRAFMAEANRRGIQRVIDSVNTALKR